MSSVFDFSEQLDGYSVRVLNERVVRAGAGILFAFAIISFMNAWLTGNFQPTRVFVVAFLVDFTIRIFVNPRYAPSLIIDGWFVRKQQPETVSRHDCGHPRMFRLTAPAFSSFPRGSCG
jgi:hypothetical protein